METELLIESDKLDEIRHELATLDEDVSKYRITNVASYEKSAEYLQLCKGQQKRIKAARDEVLEPMKKSITKVKELFEEPLERLTRIEHTVKEEIKRWSAEEKKAAQIRQDAAIEEAGKQRQKLERAAARAEKKGDVQQATSLAIAAASVVAHTETAAIPKVAGIYEKDNWTAYLIQGQEHLVPREFCVPHLPTIRGHVKSLRAACRPIPGVVIKQDSIIAAGSK